jgi:hypothetical protein
MSASGKFPRANSLLFYQLHFDLVDGWQNHATSAVKAHTNTIVFRPHRKALALLLFPYRFRGTDFKEAS